MNVVLNARNWGTHTHVSNLYSQASRSLIWTDAIEIIARPRTVTYQVSNARYRCLNHSLSVSLSISLSLSLPTISHTLLQFVVFVVLCHFWCDILLVVRLFKSRYTYCCISTSENKKEKREKRKKKTK